MEKKPAFSNADEYIAQYPPEIQAKLREIRECIRAAAPEATEIISYAMPTFYQQGNVVHYAALKKAIGLYPASSGIDHFAEELKPYRTTPGAVNFAYDEPLPCELIQRMVQFKLAENAEKAARKKSRSSG